MMSVTEQKRRDSFYLVLLGCCVFLLVGPIIGMAVPIKTFDFKCLYFGSRCLIEGHDPYSERDMQQVLHQEGGEDPQDTPVTRIVNRRFNYLPTVFAFSVPFSLLPYHAAQVAWLAGMSAVFVIASILVWKAAVQSAPLLAGGLVFLALSMNELSFAMANAAAYAVPLCVIAAWCFLRDRCVAVGVLCLSFSLMLKPHDAGFIWLYFVVAGGKCRKRALWTLLTVVVLSIPALVYVTSVAPHWLAELQANLHAYAAQGDVNDPGPSGMTGMSTIMITSLQAAFSLISDRPAFYNSATYLVCGALLVPWFVKTLRDRPSVQRAWLAIAPLSALTMLPVYHRSYDGRLLLLAIPACALLHARDRVLGWIGFMLLAAGTLVTAGVPWSMFTMALSSGRLPSWMTSPGILAFVAKATVPLVLLAVAAFFLAIYLRAAQQAEEGKTSATVSEGAA